MKDYKKLADKILKGVVFTASDIESFSILEGEQKMLILGMLEAKGYGAETVEVFLDFFASTAPQVICPQAIDVCGTGGSGLPRINASTLSAFILGSLGVGVAKHGNRAGAGNFGSFDLLESLGINIDPGLENLQYLYGQSNLNFMLAPKFYPLMGNFKSARKMLGTVSIFNILGPLLNPAQPSRQVIGCSYKDKMDLMAQALVCQNKEKVYIVRGQDGLDEVTVTGPTDVVEVCGTKIKKYRICPEDFGIKPVSLKSIMAESIEKKKDISLKILKGTSKSAHLDLVLVNTALALKLVGRVKTLKQGYDLARSEVVSGRVYMYFEKYKKDAQSLNKLTEIVGHKYGEVETFKSGLKSSKYCLSPNLRGLSKSKKSFKKALQASGLSVIAEVKQASPSRGTIVKKGFNPVKIAQAYEKNGASAISVLCDERYFQGSFDYLKLVSAAVDVPVLCKEFIIDRSQIEKARVHGADAVLLLANVLTPEQIEDFLKGARSYGMDALVEVREAGELEMVLADTSADIIGINNRDLTKFKTNLNQTSKLMKTIPADRLKNLVIISESGIDASADIAILPRRVDGILVGTGVVNDPAKVGLLRSAKPLIKICGLKDQAILEHCESMGVDKVGLNFVPTSSRFITEANAEKLLKGFDRGRLEVGGVFQNQSARFVNKVARKLNLDFVQLSGDEDLDFMKKIKFKVLKGCCIKTKSDVVRARVLHKAGFEILLESSQPGKAQSIDKNILKLIDFPYILAGGLTPEVVAKTKRSSFCRGFDTASGVEKNGKKQKTLITQFIKNSS